jgi:hypothetical protein
MNIVLKREIFKDNLTHGILFVNDKFECYTLEDTDRNLENGGVKVQNKTAIPKGTYKVTIDFSNRFQKRMMLLLKVPQFTGIRIHAGNVETETEGCVLLGQTRNKDSIGNSRLAVDKLFNQVELAINNKEQVEIKIE